MVGTARKPWQNPSLKLASAASTQQLLKHSQLQNPSLIPTSKFSDQFKKSSDEKEESSLIKKLQLHLTDRNHKPRKSPSKESGKETKPHKDLVSTILQYKKNNPKPTQPNSKQSALQLISSTHLTRRH